MIVCIVYKYFNISIYLAMPMTVRLYVTWGQASQVFGRQFSTPERPHEHSLQSVVSYSAPTLYLRTAPMILFGATRLNQWRHKSNVDTTHR